MHVPVPAFVRRGMIAVALCGFTLTALPGSPRSANAADKPRAPVEERRAGGDAVLGGQQAVEFARREMGEAEERVRRAEAEAREAAEAAARARKQYDEARGRSETARRAAEAERAKLAEAKSRHDKASAEFDRVRRGEAKK